MGMNKYDKEEQALKKFENKLNQNKDKLLEASKHVQKYRKEEYAKCLKKAKGNEELAMQYYIGDDCTKWVKTNET